MFLRQSERFKARLWRDDRKWDINACRNELRVQAGLVEGRASPIGWIDHLDLAFGCQADQLMENVVRLMVLAVHVQ